jgi:hypothetical protein
MKWNCYGLVSGSKFLGTVEADSKHEAEQKAWEELDIYIGICHHCAKQIDGAEITDLDIEPADAQA